MATVLGISAFYHDAAAALVCDGEIVAAAQEERITRKRKSWAGSRAAWSSGRGRWGDEFFAFRPRQPSPY